MFARIFEFAPASDAAAQFVEIIQEKALPIVRAQTGCLEAFVELPRTAWPIVLGVSVWRSRADAERYRRECYPDIEEMLRPFLRCNPKLRTFEVREIGHIALHMRAAVRKTPRAYRSTK